MNDTSQRNRRKTREQKIFAQFSRLSSRKFKRLFHYFANIVSPTNSRKKIKIKIKKHDIVSKPYYANCKTFRLNPLQTATPRPLDEQTVSLLENTHAGNTMRGSHRRSTISRSSNAALFGELTRDSRCYPRQIKTGSNARRGCLQRCARRLVFVSSRKRRDARTVELVNRCLPWRRVEPISSRITYSPCRKRGDKPR